MIEHLYERVFIGEGRSVVTMDDVIDAIRFCNEQYGSSLSMRNPANFMKDLVRGRNASSNWPQRLKDDRIGGRQRVGEGRVFEFEHYDEGQFDPFESSFKRSHDLRTTPVQSLSLSVASRALGRRDESWLVQVAVGLRVIETHFAVREGELLLKVLDIVHLQTGVKYGKSEVDALFFANVEQSDGSRARAILTCEAKGERERILDHQIVEQIVAANRSLRAAGLEIDLIIPIAIQAEETGAIYLVEFEPWTPAQAEVDEALLGKLVLVADGLYRLCPPVPGVGVKKKQARSRRTNT